MKVRVRSSVPDAWVLGTIVVLGAAIVLALSAVRLGALDQRPASPLNVPTLAPTALPTTIPATATPTTSTGTFEPGSSPVRIVTPAESPQPVETVVPGRKTPDLPPPGYTRPEQN